MSSDASPFPPPTFRWALAAMHLTGLLGLMGCGDEPAPASAQASPIATERLEQQARPDADSIPEVGGGCLAQDGGECVPGLQDLDVGPAVFRCDWPTSVAPPQTGSAREDAPQPPPLDPDSF